MVSSVTIVNQETEPKWKPPISVIDFATRPELLNLKLYPKQKEVLEAFWEGDYSSGVWCLGRRSGKTTMAAVCIIYAAVMYAEIFKQKVRENEDFYLLFLANSKDQAVIAMSMVQQLLKGSELLRKLIKGKPSSTCISLKNGAVFKVLPANSRTTRGLACAFAIFDEAGHFLDTNGNAAGDSLYAAISPATAQFGEYGKILMLSSPWAKQGIFWDLYQMAIAPGNERIYLANYPTWEMNPTIPASFYEQERKLKPDLFRVEYGAEFLANAAGYLDSETVERAINKERGNLSAQAKYRGKYILSLDPALHGDSYVAVIAHWEKDKLVVDRWHEFVATFVVADGKKKQVETSKVEDWILYQHGEYCFYKVILDQFQSASTIQRLSSKLRIGQLSWTSQSKTTCYAKMKELFHSGLIEIPNCYKAVTELRNLSYKILPSGAVQISGGSGTAVDDYVSALAAIFSIPRLNTSMWDNL